MPTPDNVVAITAMKHCERKHSWRDIGKQFGLKHTTVRARYLRRDKKAEVPECPACNAAPETNLKSSIKGNYASVSATGTHLLTQDGLFELSGLNRDEWRSVEYEALKWQQAAKEETGELEWTDGRMGGWKNYHGVTVTDLWSEKAKWVRTNPIALHPTIRPVECNYTYNAPPAPTQEGVERTLIIADLQTGFSRELTTAKLDPFHDRRVMDIAVQIARLIQPTRIIILGDSLDFPNWTDHFLRAPRFEYTTQPAIMELHWFLRQLREVCPDARITMHEGNHDARMRKAIMKHLRAAYGLRPADEFHLPPTLSPQRLLALHKLGIDWIGKYPDDLDWLAPELMVYHGDIIRSASAEAIRYVEKNLVSVLYGHTHRSQLHRKTYWKGGRPVTLTAYSPGCCCRIDGAVPAKSKRNNWQNGLGVIEQVGGRFSIVDIPVYDGKAIAYGQEFTGRDRLEELRADIPEWNW